MPPSCRLPSCSSPAPDVVEAVGTPHPVLPLLSHAATKQHLGGVQRRRRLHLRPQHLLLARFRWQGITWVFRGNAPLVTCPPQLPPADAPHRSTMAAQWQHDPRLRQAPDHGGHRPGDAPRTWYDNLRHAAECAGTAAYWPDPIFLPLLAL